LLDDAGLPLPPRIGLATPKEGLPPGFMPAGPFFRPNALMPRPLILCSSCISQELVDAAFSEMVNIAEKNVQRIMAR
jgi:hypothetical protein